MDVNAIFVLIEKGLSLLPILISAGVSVEQVISNLIALSKGAQAGTVTPEQLAAVEQQLDALIADFNSPMPDASS